MEYSVGFAVTDDVRAAISQVPRWAWNPAVDAGGGLRDGADVVDVTGLLDLANWPEAMRVIVRRERPHPGAQLDAFEERDGYRYQAMATDTPSANWRSSKPATAPTPGSKTGSANSKTPAPVGCHPGCSRSTRSGSNSPSPRPICSPSLRPSCWATNQT